MSTVACSGCGAIQRIPVVEAGAEARCLRCDQILDRNRSLTLSLSLAWSAALLVLLLLANLFPVMSASALGRTHKAWIVSGIMGVWGDGWPVLALILAAFVMFLPVARATLLTFVLTAVRTRWRPGWLGRLYRYADNIRLWAMPEVMIVAGFVIYMRTAEQLTAHVEPGGWCLAGAGVLSLVLNRVVTNHTVWEAIQPDREAPEHGNALGCDACMLVLPASAEGKPCPRCGRRLRIRKLNALTRTAALVAAGYIFYFPSYYFPMSYTMQPTGVKHRTIIIGVRELFQAGFWYLAVIIIIASILVPFLKLVGLTWLLFRVRSPHPENLRRQTHIHRTIHGIGRWSTTDPLIEAFSIPLLSFPGAALVHIDIAAVPFTLVVVFTMMAARLFDTRLLWDAAEGRLGAATTTHARTRLALRSTT